MKLYLHSSVRLRGLFMRLDGDQMLSGHGNEDSLTCCASHVATITWHYHNVVLAVAVMIHLQLVIAGLLSFADMLGASFCTFYYKASCGSVDPKVPAKVMDDLSRTRNCIEIYRWVRWTERPRGSLAPQGSTSPMSTKTTQTFWLFFLGMKMHRVLGPRNADNMC
jgi:hypothetical protein